MSDFTEGQRVRVIADGSTGTVNDPDYVYGGVLVMPDNPIRPWAPLTPFLPFELEALPELETSQERQHRAEGQTAACRKCHLSVTLLGGIWTVTEGDQYGEINCMADPAPYAEHEPMEG